MSFNTFGHVFRFTTWGESHGPALGAVVDGCPPGIALSEADIQPFLDKRRPGTSKFTTQRQEPDQVRILSGLFEGRTTGTPISLMIENSNTIITAHYHGTGGAISLAFMGLAIHLLPRLGYRAPDLKWATRMSYIYGTGQLLHIIGLQWSGGHGVQRQVAGAAQGLHGFAQTAGMGLMGLGGLIAVVGGIMFLVVVFKAMRRPA